MLHFSACLVACLLLKSCLAFKNDATEILYSQVVKAIPAIPSSNSTLNQARNGGRHAGFDRNSDFPQSLCNGDTTGCGKGLRGSGTTDQLNFDVSESRARTQLLMNCALDELLLVPGEVVG
ncbi:UNVERIFIED_CONTAM: hypothetical protein K2H54_037119 [Gekko kuhli]